MSGETERESSTRRAWAAHSLACAALACIAMLACRDDAPSGSSAPAGPRVARSEPKYAPEATCGECHADEARAWRGSQHAVAIQEATSETVLGDFDAPPFVSRGRTTSFSRRDGKFLVEAEGRDGKRATFPVRFTFGVEPLQQYLIELEHGRFGSLTVAWDVERKRWFDLYPGEDIAPGDELHWTGRYQRWNAMCAQCHSTDLQKSYDAANDGYRTTWSELSVGCQACHGPAQRHVELARAGGVKEGSTGFDAPLRKLAAVSRGGESRAQLDACGPCHAMRAPITERWVHGEPFLDHFLPELLRPGSYAADGQLEGEAYVHGSFLQSRMARHGVACSDCHEPHGLSLRAEGDALCTQCHQEEPPLARFPTLQRKRYDTREHTHHAPGSAGSACIACHMPTTTFMQIDARHDHSFRIPRPDESVAFGVRNACNDCHADEDARWAAAAAATWWPKLGERKTFTAAFARGRAGDASAAEELERLALDEELAPIVRGSALELAGSLGASDAAERLVADPEALVRLGALRGIEAAGGPLALDALRARVVDPFRALRVEAVRIGAHHARSKELDAATREALAWAHTEFVAAQDAQADFPGSHLNLAVVHQRRGEIPEAIAAYGRALELDPAFGPARWNLVQLLHQQNDLAGAEQVAREGIRVAPTEPSHRRLLVALLRASKRDAEALPELARIAELEPHSIDARLELAEELWRAGRRAESIAAWTRASEIDPQSREAIAGLAQAHATMGNWRAALPYAEQLARLAPRDASAQELLERARREVSVQR